jgi:hypothetical protein
MSGFYEVPIPPDDRLMDFRPGDRVRLVQMNDEHTRLQPGDEGTVQFQQDTMIHVHWDSGSTLTVLLDAGDMVELAGS